MLYHVTIAYLNWKKLLGKHTLWVQVDRKREKQNSKIDQTKVRVYDHFKQVIDLLRKKSYWKNGIYKTVDCKGEDSWVCVCVCVYVSVCLIPFTVKVNNVMLRKYYCIKNLCLHVRGNHRRKPIRQELCKRVSIKPGKVTRNKRQLL